ncbi:MAG: hypothetical protein ABSG59_06165 [Verrucomicrobiota bacterium]
MNPIDIHLRLHGLLAACNAHAPLRTIVDAESPLPIEQRTNPKRTQAHRGASCVLQISGLGLRAAYAAFDAERKFGLAALRVEEPSQCLSGLVLQGQIKPHQCPAFGAPCTPDHPLGAPMVSSEGACAAYYRYRRDTEASEAATPS